jgi:ATP-dependent DNA helicase DinG
MPSRLLRAFPPGVPVLRLPLDEVIARVEERMTADPARTVEFVQ